MLESDVSVYMCCYLLEKLDRQTLDYILEENPTRVGVYSSPEHMESSKEKQKLLPRIIFAVYLRIVKLQYAHSY